VVVERERETEDERREQQAGRQAGRQGVCISLMAAALTCDLEAGRRHRHASTCHTPRIGTALCLKSVPSSHATSQEIPRLNCSILGSESRSPVSFHLRRADTAAHPGGLDRCERDLFCSEHGLSACWSCQTDQLWAGEGGGVRNRRRCLEQPHRQDGPLLAPGAHFTDQSQEPSFRAWRIEDMTGHRRRGGVQSLLLGFSRPACLGVPPGRPEAS
jgi:hypothetical protein